MNREDALATVRRTPYPEQPAAGATDCEHRGTSRLCSCHLTVGQHGAAEELRDYTLFLFGVPYRGRIKVPHYPSGTIGFESAEVVGNSRAKAERVFRAVKKIIAEGDKTMKSNAEKSEAKKEYDRAWRAAKAKGADALAKFKADRKAKATKATG